MTPLLRDIIEGVVALLLIGRGVMSHLEHKKSQEGGKVTSDNVKDIKRVMNGEFEKRLAEEKIKWEKENNHGR